MDKNRISIAEYLQQHGSLTYRFSGTSMLPMLRQNRDLVTLERYDGSGLKRYDVAMYLRGDGKYVLHRVVEAGGEGPERQYTFLGDNCFTKEPGIPETAVVAVLKSFDREGKIVSTENRGYRLYSRAAVAAFPLRRVWGKLRRRAAKVPALKKLYRTIRKKGKH